MGFFSPSVTLKAVTGSDKIEKKIFHRQNVSVFALLGCLVFLHASLRLQRDTDEQKNDQLQVSLPLKSADNPLQNQKKL